MLHPLIALTLAFCTAAPAGPGRVAVIYSSCVDNDYRGKSDYDAQFPQLGWPVDMYRNTELDKMVARLDDYGLIYTTSLWNYGDAQDFSRWAPALKKWLAAGGCMVLTDMAYGQHLSLPPLLGDNLEVATEICKQTTFSPTFSSQVITAPNRIGGAPFWAHFTKWGSAYQVGAECGEGKPVLLMAAVGQGLLVVTTTWHHEPTLIANIWSAAEGARRGLVVFLEQMKTPLLPGEGKIPVSLLSYRDAAQKITLKIGITPTQQSFAEAETAPRQDEEVAVTLGAHEKRTVQIPYKLLYRGPMSVTVAAKTDAGTEADAEGTVVVPPALEVSVWGKHLLRKAWPAFTVKTNMPAGKAALKVIASVDGLARSQGPAKRGPAQEVVLPRGNGIATPGAHRLSFALTAGTQQIAKITTDISVDERSEPGSRVEVRGRQVLVNGKPFFPIGTYHAGPGDFKSFREHGFNCVTGPIYGGDQATLAPDQRAFYDAAAREGLMTFSELSEYLRGGRTNYEGAANIASELVPYPAMLCNYLVDEPYPAIGPEAVEHGYQAVAKADPYHPQLVCLNDPSSFGYYTKAADIYSCDPYPIPPQGGVKSLKGVADFLDMMRAKWPTGPIWVAIQSHRNPPPLTDDAKWAWLTPEQVRCMSFLALNHGGTGLLFYAWGDAYTDEAGKTRGSGFAYNKALYDSYLDLNPVLADLGPKYVTGLEKAVGLVTGQAVDAAIVHNGGERLLIVVNPLSEARTATVNLAAAKATGLKPYTKFSPEPNGATIELPPFAVGVYALQ